MAETDIKTLGYRIYDAFNARDIVAAEELFAPNFVSSCSRNSRRSEKLF